MKVGKKPLRKIIPTLYEIWETGEIKSNQGLDLNWPVASKENDKPTKNFSPSKISSSDKENKTFWLTIGTAFIIFTGLLITFLFRKRRKSKNNYRLKK